MKLCCLESQLIELNTMKKIFYSLVVAAITLLSVQQSSATHIMGMNITYKHINGDTFVMNLDFFRYCGGTAFNNGNCTGAAGIGSIAGYYARCEDNGWQGNRQAQADTIREATPICDSLNSTQNSCIVGNCGLLGIQWGIYRDTLVLDSTFHGGIECDNWIFVYASGARNTGVNYVSQPSIVAYARLDHAEDPTNSSVQFESAKPIPFFCDGQEVTYNWSAFDPDGDSLYWRLDTAWNNYVNGTFNSINYATIVGYDTFEGLDPMPGEVLINNSTGQLNFTATIPPGFNFANYAIAVLVEEYDNITGEFRGSVHRDIQFIVLDSCNNTAPLDSAGMVNFEGSGSQLDSNTIVVCTGQDFEFELVFEDFDTSGVLDPNSNITAFCNIDQILPGAIWDTTGTNPVTMNISWTAVPTNQRFVPFNVTVEDDFCPVTGFNVFSYVIRIEPSTFLPPDTSICELDSIEIFVDGGDTITWEVIDGPALDSGVNYGCYDNNCKSVWLHPSATSTYVVSSELDTACGNTDTMVVEVFNKFPINITPDSGGTADELVYCSTDPLDTLLVETPGGTFVGSGIVNQVDGVFAPDIVDPGSGRDTTVQIIYFLEGVCANADTIGIRVKGTPDGRVATEGPFCGQSTSVQLEGLFMVTDSSFQSSTWMNADSSNNPNSSGILNPSAFNAPDTIVVIHTVNDSGCIGFDSTRLLIVGEYNSNIDSLPKICEGEEVEVFLNDFEGDPFGSWTGEAIEEIPAESGKFYFRAEDKEAGEYEITYEITGDCGTSTTTNIVISELPDARFFGADSVYCDNIEDSVLLVPTREGGIWGGSLTELHDGYFVPSRVGAGIYDISYELYDSATTCYNKRILPVRIATTPAIPKVFGGGPYCQGYVLRDLRADGLLSNTFKWYEWPDYDEAIKINPDTVTSLDNLVLLGAGNPFEYGELTEMPTNVFGTQFSKEGCESGYAGVAITVLPAPVASFYPSDTTVTERNVPSIVQFVNVSDDGLPDSAAVDLLYTWTFGSFGTTNEENPEFTFEEIGKFPIKLLADNGTCQDSMTIFLTFDRLTSFYIPNVFTPNGDGQNDEFDWGVKGIDEFTIVIYNRWGTKVYESEMVDDTWDGGDEPDGTYYYIVRGKEQTLEAEPVEYRGDLTLIRN